MVAAMLVVVSLLGIRGAAAQSAPGEVEVRVAAQRLADGRTEFALQERVGGSWGERRLPSSRFFPANASVGRWLASSPLTVEVQPEGMQTASGGTSVEVRVAAQLVADGRIEFALQERVGGSWGERRLPRARFFPANARVGRWLASSALTVRAGGARWLEPDALRDSTGPPALRIIDFCRGGSGTRIDCGDSPISATGVKAWANVRFRLDGGHAVTTAQFRTDVNRLAVGPHTFEINEHQKGGWTGWSKPYTFTILPGPGTLVISRFCPGIRTDSGCRAPGANESYRWSLSARGVEDYSNLRYRIDGGGELTQLELRSSSLLPGQHTVEIREHQTGGWTGWSDPYTFTFLPSLPGPATLVITSFCLGILTESSCRAPTADERFTWSLSARGVEDYSNLRYRIDRGNELTRRELQLTSLLPGRYTVEISEHQTRGWTGWSDPHTFTVLEEVAALEIRAFCDHPGADSDLDDCHAARVTRGGPHSWWIRGTLDLGGLQVSVDGGNWTPRDDLDLRGLSLGQHNIRIGLEGPAGWTWSEPYWFTIRE